MIPIPQNRNIKFRRIAGSSPLKPSLLLLARPPFLLILAHTPLITYPRETNALR